MSLFLRVLLANAAVLAIATLMRDRVELTRYAIRRGLVEP